LSHIPDIALSLPAPGRPVHVTHEQDGEEFA
jgi:hypothetical protein